MLGVYVAGALDVAGTVVGLVARSALLPHTAVMRVGDLLVALPSSGPHTNGYSLIRRIVSGRDLGVALDDGRSLADALLAPHRCYVTEVDRLQASGVELRGLAHLTGGGFIDNIPRILPPHLAAEVDARAWAWPPLFRALLAWGGVGEREAFRIFNMGIGLVAIVPQEAAATAQRVLPEAVIVGRLVLRPSDAGVLLNL